MDKKENMRIWTSAGGDDAVQNLNNNDAVQEQQKDSCISTRTPPTMAAVPLYSSMHKKYQKIL
jgi:hypothetical protein